MNKTLRVALDVLLFLIVFVVLQLAVDVIAGYLNLYGKGYTSDKIMQLMLAGKFLLDSKVIVIATVTSSLLTIVLYVWLKWSPFSKVYVQSRQWTVLMWVAIAAIGTIIPATGLEELLKVDMPETLDQMFKGIMKEPVGYLAIGILGPLAEEMVFRGAILRRLLAIFGGNKHWIAIFISALVFGAVHGNIAQFVHALLLGLLLGWLYYRTDSIVPGVVLHWVNNTFVYVLARLMPNLQDATLTQLAGGSTLRLVLYVVFSLCILVPALYQLYARMKPAE